MKKIAISIFSGALALSSVQLFAATAVSIQYGHVTNISTVQKDKQHAGGAMAGGLFGAVFARGRHRGLKIMASSAVGAAVQGASTSGVLQLYTVALVSGTKIQVSTEQQDIRPGDCVSVEQGAHTNIRRVGTINCEPLYWPSKSIMTRLTIPTSCTLYGARSIFVTAALLTDATAATNIKLRIFRIVHPSLL